MHNFKKTSRLVWIFFICFIPLTASAEIKPETIYTETLPSEWPENWVIVNHLSAARYGRSTLIDGDSGTIKGTMSHGYWHEHLVFPKINTKEFYAVETYYSRASRGERTDVVTIYDKQNIAPQAEIIIPPKHYLATAIPNIAALTDDEQFLVIYNFTPATSISIVDVKRRKFIKEEAIGGCVLIYPSGPRQFFSLCVDGSLLHVKLDENGDIESRKQSKPFFDPDKDPITEKGVRYGDEWLFVSVNGRAYPVDFSTGRPEFRKSWDLMTEEQRKDNWKIGGYQHIAIHEADGQLYSLVHQGGVDTYKDPGTEIWVYDLASRKQVKRFKLDRPLSTIQVGQSSKPLLFGTLIYERSMDVYDAHSGHKLRTIEEIESDPTLIQIP